MQATYEILAIGNVRLREAPRDLQAEKLFIQHRNTIEKIWQEALKEKKLFNGTVLNFCRMSKEENGIEVEGNFVEYKNFLAERKRPGLNLGIKPIGVSGIILLKEEASEYVIFAQRSGGTLEYPMSFELVPSGNIDRACVTVDGTIDYKSKLLSEFSEETRLSRDYVRKLDAFAFVLDTDHKVYDICCKILIETKKELIAAKLFPDMTEYRTPEFIPISKLDDFIKANTDSIVPTSVAIIEAYMRGMRDRNQ